MSLVSFHCYVFKFTDLFLYNVQPVINPHLPHYASHTLYFSSLEVWFGSFKNIFHVSSYLLNIWTTAVRTVLMLLSDNFNICISFGSVLISWFFFSSQILFSCFFPWLEIFYWFSNIVNIVLLVAGCLCIPIHIIYVYSVTQLSYLQRVWSSLAFLF